MCHLGLVVCLLTVVNGFYLPGVLPKDYAEGDQVELKVNHLTSMRTQIPVEFYSLPFCVPHTGVVDSKENLGEILSGNVIQNSAYRIRMYEQIECAVLCKKKYSPAEKKQFMYAIDEEYLVNWIVDNLPAAFRTMTDDNRDVAMYQHGFPVGGKVLTQKKNTKLHYLNNHVDITIQHHVPDDSLEIVDGFKPARIVGLLVEPFSVQHKAPGVWNTENENANQVSSCPPLAEVGRVVPDEHKFGMILDQKKGPVEVIWTYSVQWRSSPVRWASRWDVYLNTSSVDAIHWFSITTSLLLVLVLSGSVAMILLRTLRQDLNRYNRVSTDDEKAELREESGWKLVHGDVLRGPSNPLFFSVTVGSGVQVFWMVFFSILFAALGFMNPANRGSIMLGMLMLYLFTSIAAGYSCAITYKSLNGLYWQRCTVTCMVLYPTLLLSVLFILNLVIWAEGSSSAIPFGSMALVMTLWFVISAPLTFLGAFFGYKKDVSKKPVQTHDIPRAIPDQEWYNSSLVVILSGGVLPFAASFVELFYIMSSIWLDQYYYVFGFLLLVFFILVVISAEISILMCYFQLTCEDYRWWWRSMLVPGSSSIYLMLYAVFYYHSRLHIDFFVSTVLYFGYVFIFCVMFFLLTGTVGFYATHWFVYKIFGSIKVD